MENPPVDNPIMDNSFEEQETHLSEYVMVLLKRKTLIILVFIMTVSASIFYTFTCDPIFQSSTRLIFDREKSASPITGERMDYESTTSQTMTFNTNIKMITSTPVIHQVITSLKLDADNTTRDLEVSGVKQLINQLKANVKLLLKMDQKLKANVKPLLKMDQKQSLSPEEAQNLRMQGLIAAVKGKISIQPVRDTRLLNLTVKDKNPEFAAAMANMLARKYIEFDLANKMDASKKTLEWLNNELYGLKKKLEDDEKAFFEYKQQNKVFSITDKQNLAVQKIQEFNNRYLETRNQRLELDARINELQ